LGSTSKIEGDMVGDKVGDIVGDSVGGGERNRRLVGLLVGSAGTAAVVGLGVGLNPSDFHPSSVQASPVHPLVGEAVGLEVTIMASTGE